MFSQYKLKTSTILKFHEIKSLYISLKIRRFDSKSISYAWLEQKSVSSKKCIISVIFDSWDYVCLNKAILLVIQKNKTICSYFYVFYWIFISIKTNNKYLYVIGIKVSYQLSRRLLYFSVIFVMKSLKIWPIVEMANSLEIVTVNGNNHDFAIKQNHIHKTHKSYFE